MMTDTKLAHHEDLAGLYAFLEDLFTRMEGHGAQEKVSESMKKFYCS